MSLSSMLYNIPLYQPVGTPPDESEIIVLCPQEDIKHILTTFPNHKIRLIISNKLQEQKFLSNNTKTIPIDADFTKILDFPQCYIIIFCYKINLGILNWFYLQLQQIKIGHVFICSPIPITVAEYISYSYYFSPEFFDKYRNELENVYNLFSDDESKMIFASRIKSIITGNAGYIKQSGHNQYFHPLALPSAGDTILDGGVSENTDIVRQFSQFIGDEGHVYAFEPEPACYYQASDKIVNIKNITLLPFGIWDKCEKISFISAGSSSHAVDGDTNDDCVTCHMTTIDAIAAQYNIKKIDMIKLDVEGSEEKALLGGIKTIVKHRPKLLISIYHNLNDIFELPLFVNKLDLNYKFYLGHYTPLLQECVLYALPG